MSEQDRDKTVGAISAELQGKEAPTRDPIELEREMHKDYEKNLFECIDRGKQDYPGDFYVVVITKKERIMQNVIRNYFACRQSCPTPEWDQTVYKYHRSEERIEFLWVVPSKETCEVMMQNAHDIAEEERGLLQFVLDYQDGTLYQKAKRLNGEIEQPGVQKQERGKLVW